jgi:hypothetical protein
MLEARKRMRFIKRRKRDIFRLICSSKAIHPLKVLDLRELDAVEAMV